MGLAGLCVGLPVAAQPAGSLPAATGGWLLSAGLALLGVLLAGLLVAALVYWLGRRSHSAFDAFDGIDTAPWPALTVFVAARPKDPAISTSLQQLLNADYPPERLRIVPVCEPDDAPSRAIINAYAHLFPERIVPCQRNAGEAGQSPALQQALALAQGDLALWLDAADAQGPDMFKPLVKPFFDPEVGAVTGRVAPDAVGGGWPARMLGRWSRWPVVQRLTRGDARNPAPGHSLCALRLSAVEAVGGWGISSAPPQSDRLTSAFGASSFEAICQRLQTQGWLTVNHPRALCVPAAAHGPAPVASRGPVPPGRDRLAGWAALHPHAPEPGLAGQPAPDKPDPKAVPQAAPRPRTTEPSLSIRALRAVVEPA